MREDVKPKVGKGRFQWNAGGWMGTAVGGTAWMAVAIGFLVANQESSVAIVPLGCVIVTILVAFGLWSRREHLDPFLSHMALLAVLSIATPVAWLAVGSWTSRETLDQMNWPSGFSWNLIVLFIVPGLMFMSYVTEKPVARQGTSANVID